MKTKISEWSTTPSSNTDIDGINIAEGCAPSGINDAIRDLMAQVRSWQSGASGDPFNGPMNGTVGATTAYAGAFTTLSASSTVTLSGGTANGVTYLNGSKVLTSGSALTFDGTNFTLTSGRIRNVPSTATSSGLFQSSNTGGGFYTGIEDSTGSLFTGTGYAGVVWHTGNYPIAFGVNNSEQMRLTSTGLGIGTSSPAYRVNAVVPSAADAFFADANNLAYSGYRIRAGVSGQQWAFRGGTSTMGLTDVTAGVDRVVVDLSGNLGLGVTPSAWVSPALPAFDIGTMGAIAGQNNAANLHFLANAYLGSGPAWKYKTSNYASRFTAGNDSGSGGFSWFTAPSGTAGNAITFTQAMTLDASGNLLLGETSQAYLSKFTLAYDPASYNGPIVLDNRGYGINRGGVTWYGGKYNSSGSYRPYGGISAKKENGTDGNSAGYLAFYTNGNNADASEVSRIDSSGNFIVGATSAYNPSGGGITRGTFVLDQANRTNLVVSNQTNNSSAGAALVLAAYGADWILESGAGAKSSNSLTFTYGASERARIDSSGNLLVGTTSAPAKLSIAYTTTAVFGIDIKPSADSGAYAIYFRNAANSGVGSITTSASATSYNTSSDYRLKNTIAPMTGALAKVAQLKPVTYKWNADGSDGEGFIAHELAEVIPQAVSGEKDAVNEDGSIKPQGIDTSFLVATLTSALQELNAKFDAYVASHP